MINGENGRIHSFFLGPPASGKGKLLVVAEAIQPVCKRVEAQAATENGLYGNSGCASDKTIKRDLEELCGVRNSNDTWSVPDMNAETGGEPIADI